MSEAIRSLGLCSTCRHAPTCIYQRDPKRPAVKLHVTNCEEFEIEVGLRRAQSSREPVKLSGRDVLSAGPSPGSDSEDDFARYKGLCGNCDNRKSCMYPKPEGGVWHCEEYQ